MQNRLFLFVFFLLISLRNDVIAAETIVGDWKCNIDGFDEQITFSNNNTYTKTTNIFGFEKIIQIGHWRKEGDALHLLMESQIDRSGKQSRNHDFELTVVKLSSTELITSNLNASDEKVIRTCNR